MLYLTGMFSHLFNDFFPYKTHIAWFFVRVSERRTPAELLGCTGKSEGEQEAQRPAAQPLVARRPAQQAQPRLVLSQPEGIWHDEQAQGSSKSLKTGRAQEKELPW